MSKTRPYTHLHVHSEFSLLKAACRLKDLIRSATELEMSGLALTDSGNLFAALPFMREAQAAGLQPITGMQVFVAPGTRFDRGREAKRTYEMVLLATNQEGWSNLLELATIGYLDGFYYTPRVDREVLAKHSGGLIALSGALHGEIGHLLNLDQDEQARKLAGEYGEIFGRENFYLELQDHGLPQETKVNELSVALARDLDMKLVATNNVRYTKQDDHVVLDVLLCIGQGRLRSEENRQRFGDQYFLKSPEQMNELFGHWPECLDATEEIRERTKLELDLSGTHIPEIVPPDSLAPDQYLRQLCQEGLCELYADQAEPAPAPGQKAKYEHLPASVHERLDKELGVIERMGFVNYFLITWDFINHAREIGVPVGPGRGSAAGSIVAYGLHITGIDPLRYDLLFERFLNEGRMEMPDIDIDFETDGRALVIDYVTEKYGRENVAQIITFGTMAARGALRDCARVLDVPLAKVDQIAKKVPMGSSLSEALEMEADLRDMIAQDAEVKELFEIAQRIEGLCRQAGTHAAGVIIADAPIQKYCPLFKNGEDIATQFDMRIVESVGLLKMDFLGLSTLTLIQRACEIIKESQGVEVDIEHLPLDDRKSYRLLSRGEAKGVFQFESEGMRKLLIKMKPDRFEDLIALVALYRPGPLQSGMVDKYVDVKHGRDEATYLHPDLEPVLSETYGVILYQEQVMRIASDLAGFTLQEADALRKAMGKKKVELMEKFRIKFREQAEARSYDGEVAAEIFEQMAFFAGYGFNKSHSAAYALVAYQTAWLKANYPVEFMAALLTVDSQNTDKVIAYIEEARRMGIRMLPPDINRSAAHFTVEQIHPDELPVLKGLAVATGGTGARRNGGGRRTGGGQNGAGQDAAGEPKKRQKKERHIRFGLGAIKGVGMKAIESTVAEAGIGTGGERQPFTSLYDFCERVDVRLVNKATCDALIKAGAFDQFSENRAALLASLDKAMASGARAQKDKSIGQASLFGGELVAETAEPELPDVPEWPERERLAFEKEVLGFYLSGHPLAEHAALVRDYSTTTALEIGELQDGAEVLVGGMVTALGIRVIQKEGRNQGKKMAKFVLEDLSGSVGCVCFPSQYEKQAEFLVEDAIVFLKGKVSARGAEPEILIDDVLSRERAAEELTRNVLLVVPAAQAENEAFYQELRTTARTHQGNVPLLLELTASEGERVTIRTDGDNWVKPTPEFVAAAHELVGSDNVHLLAR